MYRRSSQHAISSSINTAITVFDPPPVRHSRSPRSLRSSPRQSPNRASITRERSPQLQFVPRPSSPQSVSPIPIPVENRLARLERIGNQRKEETYSSVR